MRIGQEVAPITDNEAPLIIGRRGAAGHAPENTLAAFRAAVHLGADAVSFGVQFTSDGHPVAFHDRTLRRMAGVGVCIREHSLSVLEGFDIGFLHSEEHRGERIPPVEEIARLVPPSLQLHVEIRDCDRVTEDHLRRLFATLERCGGLSRVICFSPHEESLVELKRLFPDLRIGLVVARDVRVPSDAVRRAAYVGCDSVAADVALVDPDLAKICHRHTMKLFAFPVNERESMRRLLAMGVDGFVTDYPDRLRTVPDTSTAQPVSSPQAGAHGTLS